MEGKLVEPFRADIGRIARVSAMLLSSLSVSKTFGVVLLEPVAKFSFTSRSFRS
jgi:hypothetical protein